MFQERNLLPNHFPTGPSLAARLYRHSSGKRRLREVCAGFYNEDEIFEAKTVLHSKNPSLFGEFVKRQDSETLGGEQNMRSAWMIFKIGFASWMIMKSH